MEAILSRGIGLAVLAAVLLGATVFLRGGASASSGDETSRFIGLACVDTRCDEPAIGSEVAATVNGGECASVTSGPFSDGEVLSYYTLYIPVGEPGCGAAGATVEFTINGRPAKQTAVLQVGEHWLDLYVGEDFAHYHGLADLQRGAVLSGVHALSLDGHGSRLRKRRVLLVDQSFWLAARPRLP